MPYCRKLWTNPKRSIKRQCALHCPLQSTPVRSTMGTSNNPAKEKRTPESIMGGIYSNPILAPAKADPQRNVATKARR